MIEERLVEAGRSWSDLLQSALVETKGEEQGLILLRRYRRGLPGRLSRGDRRRRRRSSTSSGSRRSTRPARSALHLYPPDRIGAERAALQALPPRRRRCRCPTCCRCWSISASRWSSRGPDRGQSGRRKARRRSGSTISRCAAAAATAIDARTALKAVFQTPSSGSGPASMEDDGFNRLVLAGGLDWRVDHAAARLCQVSCARPASPSARRRSRTRWPRIRRSTRAIVRLFTARFDPDMTGDREVGDPRHAGRDRACARRGHQPGRGPHPPPLPEPVRSTLRTNFFQTDDRGRGRSPTSR